MLTIQEFASKLKGVKKATNGWTSALCPSHDDHRESFSFRLDDKGIQFKCHAGCERKAILAAMGIKETDVWVPSPRPPRGPVIEATYPYRDETGRLLFETVRLFPKKFFQRRPATPMDPPEKVKRDQDGREWVNSLKGADGRPIPRVLYRLPEILAAVAAGRTVFVVEGEKDADALVRLGLDATTAPQGAGKWDHSFSLPLARAARVVVCPDNDPPAQDSKEKGFPGQRHAADIVRSLLNAGIAPDHLQVLELPGAKDASDWIAAGGTADAFLRLAEGALAGMAWLQAWEPRLGPAGRGTCGAGGASADRTAILDLRNTDKGNADRLVAMFGDDLLFDGDEWYVWDGCRYALDVRDRRMELAKKVAEANLRDALAIQDDNDRDAAVRAARKCLQLQRLQAMIDLAASDPRIRVVPDDLDADLSLLNVTNGTIDLRTGTLRPHARADRCTKLASVAFDPAAESPRFLSFLDFIMGGNATLVAYLQRFAGSCLSGDASDQVFHVWFGGGSNGKGTLIRQLLRVMGEYACQANTETFLEHATEPNGASHQEDLARLKGIRFVAAEEASPGRRLNIGRIKQMTGGDRIVARRPWGRRSIEYTPQFTLVFATNHPLSVPSADYGTWRRLRQCPFTATITEDMRNAEPDFEAKLAAEDAGILRWAVEGCIAWRREGIHPPEEVIEATKEWRADTNPIVRFISEKCVTGPERQCGATDLYAAYKAWCVENDEEPLKQRSFGTKLSELQFRTDRGAKGRIKRLGIALRGPGEGLNEGEPLPPLDFNAHASAAARTPGKDTGETLHQGSIVHPADPAPVDDDADMEPAPDSFPICPRCGRAAMPCYGAERLSNGEVVCGDCLTPADLEAGSTPLPADDAVDHDCDEWRE